MGSQVHLWEGVSGRYIDVTLTLQQVHLWEGVSGRVWVAREVATTGRSVWGALDAREARYLSPSLSLHFSLSLFLLLLPLSSLPLLPSRPTLSLLSLPLCSASGAYMYLQLICSVRSGVYLARSHACAR